MTSNESRIDLLHKDRDPRKTNYFFHLLRRHQDVIRLWRLYGIMAGMSVDKDQVEHERTWGHTVRAKNEHEFHRRKHFAPEHMSTVIAGCRALGDLLINKSLLTEESVLQVEKAAAVHDAGKELEYVLVSRSLQAPLTNVEEVLDELNVTIGNQSQLDQEIGNYREALSGDSAGFRALAAYDLAQAINSLRLKEAGFSPELIRLQSVVGHSSCPEIEDLLSGYQRLSPDEQKTALMMFILHYIDDVTTNPNVIDPQITQGEDGVYQNALDRRCAQNERNPKYAEYNLAWREDRRNRTNETAFSMQRRVGHLVEMLLADKLGIDNPLSLPMVVNEQVQQNILSFNQ